MKVHVSDGTSSEADEHLALQRVRVQEREKQFQAEYNAAKEIFNNKIMEPVSKPSADLGPSLQSLVKREQERRCALIAQHNQLHFTVGCREVQLLELEQRMKSLEQYNAPDTTERMQNQRVRQLENNLEKMSLKITAAETIRNTGLNLQEHLQHEVREMPQALEKLHKTILNNHVDICKVAMMSQSAQAGLDTSKSMLLQMENQLMLEQQVIESKLSELEKAKEKQARGHSDYQPGEDGNISKAVQMMKEQGKKAELIDQSAVQMSQQFGGQAGISQSEIKLIESIDELKEALGSTDMQELVTCLASQKALQKHLLSQLTKSEETVKQQQEDLDVLELHHAQLKFTDGSRTERYDKQKAELEKDLCREQERCNRWQSRVDQTQMELQSIEQGFNNVHYRMTCDSAKVFGFELSLPRSQSPQKESSLDAMRRLSEIRAYLYSFKRLPSDLVENQIQLDQEQMRSSPEQNLMMEPSNFRSVNRSFPGHAKDESLKVFCQDDCSLTREEIKRRGIQLIEASHFKQNRNKAFKKS